MTCSKHIDYINTYFEYPVLTKIHGRPNYDNIKIIKDEMKTNGASVSSELGGGANGHVGIVTTNTDYIMVAVVPYVRP